jgi:hypothetical protein
MATKKITSRLDRWEADYVDLKRSLLDLGYICPGSVVERYVPCGKSNCCCMANPNDRHGPYYEWSRKVRGKTITVRLPKEQAALYEEFTKNNQKLRKVCDRMKSISIKVAHAKRKTQETG